MRTQWMALVLTVVATAGCGDYKPQPLPAPRSAPQTSTAAPNSAQAPAATPAATPAPAPVPAPVAAPAPSTPAPAPPGQVVEKADTGVGAKGRDYGPGLVTTPIAQYFQARQSIVFRIQIPEALKLYKATHEHNPQSMEEFMAVMKENQITLPDLPEGHKYIYDPQSGELQVSHPRVR